VLRANALLVVVLAGCATVPPPSTPGGAAARAPAPARAEEVQVLFLEPVDDAGPAGLPLLRALPDRDPRLAECRRLLDNEAARFIRRLIAAAERKADPTLPANAPPPALPIVLKKGGNHARTGYRLALRGKVVERPRAPYVLLECTAARLSGTLLHEGGHVLHEVATRGRRAKAPWTATVHSTFAVTDPITALSEGFAIHLETLWGHFGSDPERRAFYHRLEPRFGDRGSSAGEFYSPVRDLQTFSQTFARYHAVRDGLPVFAGNVFRSEYLRSQYDPSRDMATLKRPNAIIASEGVVASVLFWIVVGSAGQDAKPGGGLDQPALAAAEARLLDALFALPGEPPGPFRPDILDLVAAYADLGPRERRVAVSRFLDLTRAVTARPRVAALWARLYRAALTVDRAQTMTLLRELEQLRAEAAEAAEKDPGALRGGIGPVVPVRVDGRELRIVGLGEAFPMELDLNAAGPAEWAAMPRLDEALRARARAELDKGPFQSLSDFERRIGVPAAKLGLSRAGPSAGRSGR